MGISPQRNLSRRGRAALALLALALIGLLAAQGCTLSSQSTSIDQQGTIRLKVGDMAPDFTLADLEGNDVTLSDLRGKVILVNFWATWCPACRAEMPEMESLYQEYKDKDVVVLGVDVMEQEDKVREFVQQRGYSWTFVTDTTGAVTRNYGITATPTSFFLDKEGIIRAVHIGFMTRTAMVVSLAKAIR